MSDETLYTAAGYPLADCPLEFLQREAAAARSLLTDGYDSGDNWAKLRAVEHEIKRRAPDPRDAVVAAVETFLSALKEYGINLDNSWIATQYDALRDALAGLPGDLDRETRSQPPS